MSDYSKKTEISPICDTMMQSWLYQYPEDKTTTLNDKLFILDKAVAFHEERFTHYLSAKDALRHLANRLDNLKCVEQKFLVKNSAYDFGQAADAVCHVQQAISKRRQQLYDYIRHAENDCFPDLSRMQHNLNALTALRNFYRFLSAAVTTIRLYYFKTEPDKRIFIIKDLELYFDNIVNNYGIFNLRSDIPNPLLPDSIDQASEYDSIVHVHEKARATLQTIKNIL